MLADSGHFLNYIRLAGVQIQSESTTYEQGKQKIAFDDNEPNSLSVLAVLPFSETPDGQRHLGLHQRLDSFINKD